ncbi:hypothetical protein NW069_02090 [Mycoplasmopsis cynos]|nr:hypothetical protein [Mycoplasmopsis cynos]UWV80919.1 hypothetical protein NW069_02090 [Mycoplasmopsis cynos]
MTINLIDTLKDDEKDAVIKYYYRIFSENNIDADIKNIKEIEKAFIKQ